MPICVSDYKWWQTPDKVTVMLDLHHTSPKKVDVVTTSSYLKVSFLPYIFEVFLCHMINVGDSSARIMQGHLELILVKEIPQEWEEFGLKLTKEEMELRRKEEIRNMMEDEKRKDTKRREEGIKRERFAVSQQIQADEQMRAERSRAVEKEKADFFRSADIYKGQGHQPEKSDMQKNVKEQLEKCRNAEDVKQPSVKSIIQKDEIQSEALRGRVPSTCSEDGAASTQEADYDGDGEDSIYYSSTENLCHMNGSTKHEMAANRRLRKSNRKVAGKDKEITKKRIQAVPPVRASGSITITHTHRVFPSPARESTQTEEQQWLEAQSKSFSGTQVAETSTSQLREEHFKKKAATLFKSGDYQGCVNACTEGLRVNPSSPAFYSNRAAAHLALKNLHHTLKDCTKALELLTPPTPENSNSRLLCHIRRGTALVRLSLLSEGLIDYQTALQLSPENKALKKDVEMIQSMLIASTDSNEDSGCEPEEGRRD